MNGYKSGIFLKSIRGRLSIGAALLHESREENPYALNYYYCSADAAVSEYGEDMVQSVVAGFRPLRQEIP